MGNLPEIRGCILEKELGKGGMADVYLGIQESLGRKVAVKVLLPELFRDDTFSKRFIKEARTAASLIHPNIVTIHDVGVTGKSHFIVMEYLSDTLKDKLKKSPLSPKEALSIVKSVASALDYAHSKGFIHRDIKPDNIMFREDGTPVLVDFGIARAIGSNTKLTKTGMSIGTPHYMSPEQARGKPLDGRSDIYSLGVVLYEMLTGETPYGGEDSDSIAIAIKHIQEPIPDLRSGGFGISGSGDGEIEKLQNIINLMMAKDPDDRPQTGAELIELLSQETGDLGQGTGRLETGVRKQGTVEKLQPQTDNVVANGDLPESSVGAELASVQNKGKNKKVLYLSLLLILIVAFTIWYTIDIKQPSVIVNSTSISISDFEFVKVEGGEFNMGSRSGESDEKPVRRVYVDTFYISKYEVTVGNFKKFINDSGYKTEAEKSGGGYVYVGGKWENRRDANWRSPYFIQNDNLPVTLVSWNDAVSYCKWLSRKTGRNIHLPTEAQWEYASRGGNRSRGYKYSGSDSASEVGWYDGNSGSKTHRVGEKIPNELGLYDMSGNVWEWCLDWYSKSYYKHSPYKNPKGPSRGSSRVARGGSWYVSARYIRSADRSFGTPSYRFGNLGFRLVLD